ncbi:hypothetical protein ALC60_11457 [Trachymyrmex zeteki]|uniref:Uncharacterized protein n=1 Tax=Mycetomoellerius zeteki TaxID=64791 RepID=A0A151WN68_9HYME|nr:hypothetical protein ALC60_11457 [Trachymyrmex zeteki]
MFRHSKQTGSHATLVLSCSDRYLFVMKSRRASHSLFHGSYGEPDSRMLATLPLRMHSEQIVNNTKQPRQTNIAFGFTGDTHVLVALLPHGKLLYRANTPPYSLVDSSIEILRASSEMIGSRRKVDKDQTPAIYFAIGLTWSDNFVVGAYHDVLSPFLPLCRFGPSSRGV